MGRAKIQIKKIEDNTNRHVTFCKRRRGLFKKARELSILCDADVALAVVSSTGRVFHYASSKNMEKILHEADKLRERHGTNAALPWPQLINDHLNSAKEHTPGNCSMAQSGSDGNLRSQVEKLQMELRLRNGDVKDMCNIKELVELEAKMERALQKVKRRRFEVSCNELEMLKKKQKQLEMDNYELRRQVQSRMDKCNSTVRVAAISTSTSYESNLLQRYDINDEVTLVEHSASSNRNLVQLRLLT